MTNKTLQGRAGLLGDDRRQARRRDRDQGSCATPTAFEGPGYVVKLDTNAITPARKLGRAGDPVRGRAGRANGLGRWPSDAERGIRPHAWRTHSKPYSTPAAKRGPTHEEACEDGEANTPHGQALIASRYARLCELEAQCAAEIFQELLDRRAAIETELRRPFKPPESAVAELHAELKSPATPDRRGLAEASKETP
jgi:hypothetical protein